MQAALAAKREARHQREQDKAVAKQFQTERMHQLQKGGCDSCCCCCCCCCCCRCCRGGGGAAAPLWLLPPLLLLLLLCDFYRCQMVRGHSNSRSCVLRREE